MTTPATPQPSLPTTVQVQTDLNALLQQIMISFRNARVDGYTINSIGKVLSQLKFDGTQTLTETQLLISRVANEQVEAMKLAMLRASITN